MILDAHVHLFPEEFQRQRERLCELDRAFASVYSDPRARMASSHDILKALNEVEATAAVVFGFPWTDRGLCKEHNDFVKETCAASRGRLIGLCCVSPSLGEWAVSEAERCLAMGLRGIGEVASYQDPKGGYDSPFFQGVADILVKKDLPLLLHVTESVGHAYAGKDRTDLWELYRWIQRNPDLHLVLAHWGGGLFLYELMPEVREACRRVYYDTAASPFLYDPKIYEIALKITGRDRILLGSDYPLIHPRRYLKEIDSLGLPAEETCGLLGVNAARLFALHGESRPQRP